MNKLATILLLTALSGCSLLPSKFDSALYDHLVELSVDADLAQGKCGTPGMQGAVSALNRESKQALTYSQYADKDVFASVALVDKAVTEMDTMYQAGTPSNAYCKLKLQIVNTDLDLILTGLGGKSK